LTWVWDYFFSWENFLFPLCLIAVSLLIGGLYPVPLYWGYSLLGSIYVEVLAATVLMTPTLMSCLCIEVQAYFQVWYRSLHLSTQGDCYISLYTLPSDNSSFLSSWISPLFLISPAVHLRKNY
jgi:hypothetical protein